MAIKPYKEFYTPPSDEIVMVEIMPLKLYGEQYYKHSASIGFDSLQFPIVRRVHATTLAQELVSVQPMSAPLGLFNYTEYSYG